MITLFAWLPLLVLSAVEGNAFGGAMRVPFLLDIEVHSKVHSRFLVALPLLILSEMLVHKGLAPALEQFLRRGIIRPVDRSRFEDIVYDAAP